MSHYETIQDFKEQAIWAVPSVFGTTKRHNLTENYKVVQTQDVLEALEGHGYVVATANQKRTRKTSDADYAKHVVRLRHVDDSRSALVNGRLGVPEVCIWNAHNGTSAFKINLGWYEFVCANGLVVGSSFMSKSVTHKGDNVLDRVIDATYEVVTEKNRLSAFQADMQGTLLTKEASKEYATEVCKAIWGPDTTDWQVEPEWLLFRRHRAQRDLTLWNTFNAVQENIVRGGMPVNYEYRLKKAQEGNHKLPSRSRKITGLERLNRVNRDMWDVAEHFLKVAA